MQEYLIHLTHSCCGHLHSDQPHLSSAHIDPCSSFCARFISLYLVGRGVSEEISNFWEPTKTSKNVFDTASSCFAGGFPLWYLVHQDTRSRSRNHSFASSVFYSITMSIRLGYWLVLFTETSNISKMNNGRKMVSLVDFSVLVRHLSDSVAWQLHVQLCSSEFRVTLQKWIEEEEFIMKTELVARKVGWGIRSQLGRKCPRKRPFPNGRNGCRIANNTKKVNRIERCSLN